VDPRVGLDDVDKLKFLTLPRLVLDPSVVQPVGSCHTDYATTDIFLSLQSRPMSLRSNYPARL
jgi:hypothetical protein